MPAKKQESPDSKYTDPKLHERIKKKVMAGDKGGNAGEWSARKAQLVTQEYKRQGGGFKGKRTEGQQSLQKWTAEDWQTSDGKTARRAGGTTRYLPKNAWKQLSTAQKRSTNRKKQEGSRQGEQFVANTTAAATARKKATSKQTAANKKSAAKKKAAPAKRKRTSAK